MRYLLLSLLTGCVSTPVWSADHTTQDVIIVTVDRVYYNQESTLTVIPPNDGGAE